MFLSTYSDNLKNIKRRKRRNETAVINFLLDKYVI